MTRAVLPYFRQARSGTLVFIGSLSGWVGHGYVGAYAGSKFALEGKNVMNSHFIHVLTYRTRCCRESEQGDSALWHSNTVNGTREISNKTPLSK